MVLLYVFGLCVRRSAEARDGIWWLLMGVACRLLFPLLRSYTNALAKMASPS